MPAYGSRPGRRHRIHRRRRRDPTSGRAWTAASPRRARQPRVGRRSVAAAARATPIRRARWPTAIRKAAASGDPGLGGHGDPEGSAATGSVAAMATQGPARPGRRPRRSGGLGRPRGSLPGGLRGYRLGGWERRCGHPGPAPRASQADSGSGASGGGSPLSGSSQDGSSGDGSVILQPGCWTGRRRGPGPARPATPPPADVPVSRRRSGRSSVGHSGSAAAWGTRPDPTLSSMAGPGVSHPGHGDAIIDRHARCVQTPAVPVAVWTLDGGLRADR